MVLHHSSDEELVERLANEIAGAFAVAFFELETIRATAEEFGNDVAKLMAVSIPTKENENSHGAFQASMLNASSAAAAAENLAESLMNRAFQGALIRISGALLEMKKHTVSLKSISYLTKITQTEADDCSGRLSAFSDTLDSRCLELKNATALSADLVGETQRQSSLAREALTSIGIEFRTLSDGTDEEGERLLVLEERHRAHISEIRQDAHQLGEEVRAAVAGLIGCLQFPDSFAQRSEHVRAAIGAMATASPPERAALGKVTAAQLAAMARGLTEVCETATRALATLKATLAENPTLHGRSDASNPSDEWMAANGRANEAMLVTLQRARQQFDAALNLIEGLTGQIDATQKNLETSVRLNRELEASVHNASVVAHRVGSRASPFQFLAGSVKDVVDRTSSIIKQISDALEHIRGTSKALAASTLHQDLEKLVVLQANAAADATAQTENVTHVHGLRRQLRVHAERLDGAATAAGNAFDAASEQADAIADLGRKIHEASEAVTDRSYDLAWLYAIYTMEEERLVHRETLGLPAPDNAMTAVDEDLDDFML